MPPDSLPSPVPAPTTPTDTSPPLSLKTPKVEVAKDPCSILLPTQESIFSLNKSLNPPPSLHKAMVPAPWLEPSNYQAT